MTLSFERICVLTDLEPDDILAIYLLFDNVSRDTETLFIVGEGNVAKDKMCFEMCETLGLTNFTVLQGNMSHKDYPPLMLTLFDFSDEKTLYRPCEQATEESLSRFDFSNSLVLGLKPFSELLDFVDAERLTTATFCFYGSFNLRCMLSKHSATDIADFVNTAFEKTFVYESYFATGEENSASAENFPALFEALENSPRLEPVLKAIALWNEHIAKDCANTISKLAVRIEKQVVKKSWQQLEKSAERLIRSNAKILLNIAKSRSQQMVIADFALVACLFCQNENDAVSIAERKPVSFSFGEHNYSHFTPEATAQVFLIENVDQFVLKRHIIPRDKF